MEYRNELSCRNVGRTCLFFAEFYDVTGCAPFDVDKIVILVKFKQIHILYSYFHFRQCGYGADCFMRLRVYRELLLGFVEHCVFESGVCGVSVFRRQCVVSGVHQNLRVCGVRKFFTVEAYSGRVGYLESEVSEMRIDVFVCFCDIIVGC